MRKLVCACTALFLFSGCTMIRDYRVRAKIEEQITAQMKEDIAEDYVKTLGAEFPRQNDFIAFVLGRTTIEVGEITELAPDSYAALAKVRTVSPAAIGNLREIIRPLRDGKLNAFNFENGLALLGERGIPTVSEQERRITVEL